MIDNNEVAAGLMVHIPPESANALKWLKLTLSYIKSGLELGLGLELGSWPIISAEEAGKGRALMQVLPPRWPCLLTKITAFVSINSLTLPVPAYVLYVWFLLYLLLIISICGLCLRQGRFLLKMAGNSQTTRSGQLTFQPNCAELTSVLSALQSCSPAEYSCRGKQENQPCNQGKATNVATKLRHTSWVSFILILRY